jgi:hypothetical protein
VDPKLFVTDTDPTFQRVSDPDQTFLKFRIRPQIFNSSSRDMILKVIKLHFRNYFSNSQNYAITPLFDGFY